MASHSIALLAALSWGVPVLAGVPLVRWWGLPVGAGRLGALVIAHGVGLAWMSILAYALGLAGADLTTLGASALTIVAVLWLAAPRAHPNPAGALARSPVYVDIGLALVLTAAGLACAYRGAEQSGIDRFQYQAWMHAHAESDRILPPDPLGGLQDGIWMRRTPWHLWGGLVGRAAGLEVWEAWPWLPAVLAPTFMGGMYIYINALGLGPVVSLVSVVLAFVCLGGTGANPPAMLAWSRFGPLPVLWIAQAYAIRWMWSGDRASLAATLLTLAGAAALNVRFLLYLALALPGLLVASLSQAEARHRGRGALRAVALAGCGGLLALAVGTPIRFGRHAGLALPDTTGLSGRYLWLTDNLFMLDPSSPEVLLELWWPGLVALGQVLPLAACRGREARVLAALLAAPILVLFNPWVFPAFARLTIDFASYQRILVDPVPWTVPLAIVLCDPLGVGSVACRIRWARPLHLTGAVLATLSLLWLCGERPPLARPSGTTAASPDRMAASCHHLGLLDLVLPPRTRVLADGELTLAIPARTLCHAVDGGLWYNDALRKGGTETPFTVARWLLDQPAREGEAAAAMAARGVRHLLLGEGQLGMRAGSAGRLVASGRFRLLARSGPLALLELRTGIEPSGRPQAIAPVRARGGARLEASRLSLIDGASGPGLTLRVGMTWTLVDPLWGQPQTTVELVAPPARWQALYDPRWGRLHRALLRLMTGNSTFFSFSSPWSAEPGLWSPPRVHVDIDLNLAPIHEGMVPEPYEVRVGYLAPGQPIRRFLRLDDAPALPTVRVGWIRRVPDTSSAGFHLQVASRR